MRVEIGRLSEHVGGTVTVEGWVETSRSHGKVAFLTVRDGSGVLQGVLVQREVPASAWE